MKAFLLSNAGKGTVGVLLTCVIVIWPLVANWMVAALTLYFAVRHFRESFRKIDAEAAYAADRTDLPATFTVRAAPARGEAPPCDMAGVMAAVATQAAGPLRQLR